MDITLIPAIVTSIAVTVGVVFAMLQMRHATKTRYTGLIVQLNSALQTNLSDLTEASKILNLRFNNYKDFLENYGDPLTHEAFITITAFYDGLGFLLHKRLIDIELTEYILGGLMTTIWRKLGPVIIEMRKDRNLPELFKWFEYLYEEMEKS
jgi:hypothetical protein